jgi:nanoRNase/pAp phosphatase (c-di-AMP/oligoRNAs hydrolase)
VVEPRPGGPILSQDKVSFSYSGLSADLIVTIDAQRLENLGKFYQDNKNLFEEKQTLVIDNKTTNTQYGKINLVRPTASIGELMTRLILDLQLPFDQDIASNLYDGVVMGSRTFSSPAVTADTFEIAAQLLRAGARKPDWLKPKIYKGSQLL